MTGQRTKSLILIPDYMSVRSIHGQPSDALIVGDPDKVPGELRTDRFLDVTDAASRRTVVQMVPEVAPAAVVTPSMAFYRRVFELRDDCFFADLTARLLATGAHVSIVSGMQRVRVPKRAAEWLRDLSADGARIVFEDAPETTGGAPELITAADVAACGRQGRKELLAAPRAIVTPAARDEAKERGITILTGTGGLI